MKFNLIETVIQAFNPNYRTPLYALKLKELRIATKKSKSEFATSLGYIRNPIPYYLAEAGLQTIDYEFIQKVCCVYNIDANWFLGLIPDIEIAEDLKIVVPEKLNSEKGENK